MKVPQNAKVPQSMKPENALIIRKMDEDGLILNHPTFDVYERYITLCNERGISPQYNKITFSKAIHQFLGYPIKGVKRGGRKCRIFVEKV